MSIIKLSIFLFTIFTISSCSTTLHVVYDQRELTSDQKIAGVQKLVDGSSNKSRELSYTRSGGNRPCYSGLDCAIYTKDYKVTKFLLENGANPNVKPKEWKYSYIIQKAILNSTSDEELLPYLALLLKYKADPHQCHYYNSTAANMTIMKHYLKSTMYILSNGGSMKTSSCKDNHYTSGRGYNDSPLVQAIRSGRNGNQNDLAIIIAIFQAGADPLHLGFARDSRKNFSYTPMSYAIKRGKKTMANDLMDYFVNKDWEKDWKREYFFKEVKSRDGKLAKYFEEKARNKKSREAWKAKEDAMFGRNKIKKQESTFATFIGAATKSMENSSINKGGPRSGRVSYANKSSSTSTSSSSKASSAAATKSSSSKGTTCNDPKHCNAKFDGKRTALKKSHIHKFSSKKSNVHACANTRLHMSGYQDVCSSFGGRKNAGSAHVPFPVGIDYQSCKCSSFGNCQTKMTVYCAY